MQLEPRHTAFETCQGFLKTDIYGKYNGTILNKGKRQVEYFK